MPISGSQTLRVRDPLPTILWRGREGDDGRLHAFPQVDGAAGLHALCGRRWSALHRLERGPRHELCETALRLVEAGASPTEAL